MATTTTDWTDDLRALGACSESIALAKGGGYATLDGAWAACDNPRWMLWYAGRMAGARGSLGRRKIVVVACEIARLVLPIFEAKRPDDKRPRVAIETAERYARGEDVSLADIRAAYAADVDAAYDAAYAAAYAAHDAAYDAAYAAADDADVAAYAAYDAAADVAAAADVDAAADAAYAAAAAADVAAYAAYDAAAAAAARASVKVDILAIVRRHYPTPPSKE
jgi:hypothetical protein